MALPVFSVPGLQWSRYNQSLTNLVQQFGLDFSTYSAYTFNPSGTVSGSVKNDSISADGVGIDNTANATAVTVSVGSLFTESVPAYTKSLIILGGTAPVVTITATAGIVLATFFKGSYPGSIAQTNLLAATKQAIGVYLPSDVMMMYAGLVGNVPDGWLLCDGSALSRITYASLFGAIGELYGSGDGTSTFNIPDMRGKFARGYDNGKGVDVGRVLGSNQPDSVINHQHKMPLSFNGNSINTNYSNPGGIPLYGASTTIGSTPWSLLSGPVAQTGAVVGAAYTDSVINIPVGSGTETRPKNVAVNYIVKV